MGIWGPGWRGLTLDGASTARRPGGRRGRSLRGEPRRVVSLPVWLSFCHPFVYIRETCLSLKCNMCSLLSRPVFLAGGEEAGGPWGRRARRSWQWCGAALLLAHFLSNSGILWLCEWPGSGIALAFLCSSGVQRSDRCLPKKGEGGWGKGGGYQA